MTGQLQPTDERLDRLIERLLAERGEDVASVALSADAMAERIAMRLRPSYGLRAGFVLVAVLGLLLVGIVAAAALGWLPTAPPPTPTTFDCEAKLVEFEGEMPYSITVRDETGMFTACRQITADAATALRDAFGTPLGVLNADSVEITKANADGTHLLVVWAIFGCDESAQVDLSPTSDRTELVVTKRQVGRCPPGGGLVAVELTADQALSPGDVAGTVIRDATFP